MPLPVIRGFGVLKAASAQVNRELGMLDEQLAGYITTAALEVAEGRWNDEFPCASGRPAAAPRPT